MCRQPGARREASVNSIGNAFKAHKISLLAYSRQPRPPRLAPSGIGLDSPPLAPWLGADRFRDPTSAITITRGHGQANNPSRAAGRGIKAMTNPPP